MHASNSNLEHSISTNREMFLKDYLKKLSGFPEGVYTLLCSLWCTITHVHIYNHVHVHVGL